MPAAFAHDLYGRRVYERLRPEIRRFIKKNKDCFYLGVHGPDILFYYYPLGENSIVKEGYRIHEAPAREFFMEGIEKLRNTDSPVEKSAKKAYLLGFACHFALDSSLHGYINEKDRTAGLTHAGIETELDRRLMIREGMRPLWTDRTSHIKNTGIVCRSAANLLNTSDAVIARAIDTIKLVNRIFINSSEPVKEMICLFLKARGKYEVIHGMLMRKEPIAGMGEVTDYLEREFFDAVPLGAELLTSLWDSMTFGWPLPARFDRNFN